MTLAFSTWFAPPIRGTVRVPTTTGDTMTYTLIDDTGERTYTTAGFRAMLGRIWEAAAAGANIIIVDNHRAF